MQLTFDFMDDYAFYDDLLCDWLQDDPPLYVTVVNPFTGLVEEF